MCSDKQSLISVSRLQHGGPLHFCTTPPCLEAAADLLSKQNASYDACTDFWDHACGGWLSRNPIPPTASSWSTLEALRTKLITEKSRLITTSAHEPSQFNSVEWKVANFYASCMALSFIESDHEKPLLKVSMILNLANQILEIIKVLIAGHQCSRRLGGAEKLQHLFLGRPQGPAEAARRLRGSCLLQGVRGCRRGLQGRQEQRDLHHAGRPRHAQPRLLLGQVLKLKC